MKKLYGGIKEVFIDGKKVNLIDNKSNVNSNYLFTYYKSKSSAELKIEIEIYIYGTSRFEVKDIYDIKITDNNDDTIDYCDFNIKHIEFNTGKNIEDICYTYLKFIRNTIIN